MEQAERSDVGTADGTFFYDDCCPLCRGYTAVFAGLGWADRAGFSGLDEERLADLDLERARHHIPLHDPASGAVRYGLDGILGIVEANAPVLGGLGNHRRMRPALDRLYWFITYNRRHIVAAKPPERGFDCAPDFEPAAVRRYHVFCGVVTTALAVAAGTEVVTAAVVAGTGVAAAKRHPDWQMRSAQALGHVGTVAMAGAAGGAAARALTGSPRVAAVGTLAAATRKLWLRRWMLTPPAPA